MEQITRPLEVIESEINFYKSQTASGIIEIGKRLIEAKEQLQHGKWGEWLEEKVEFSNVTASRFMRVASECSNISALKDLPKTKVFALLDVPEDQREEFVQSNPVEEMTTRELQEAIKKTKQLELQLKEEKNKPPKEVVPADYNLLKSRLEIKEEKIRSLEREKEILELKAEASEKDAERYNNLTSQIDLLAREKDDLHRIISATTELSGLAAEAKIFFETRLAPVKYSRAIREACEDEIVRNNLVDIIETFQGWINEMSQYIPNHKTAIEVEGRVIDE
jgi:hypothetical protein